MLRNVVRVFIVFPLLSSWPDPAQSENLGRVDGIVVIKSTHTMTLYSAGKVLKVYHVSLGSGGGEAKQRLGDRETPEGRYTIDGRNAHSTCHLALHISYPNVADRQHARSLGVAPGGDVMIHGLPNGYVLSPNAGPLGDWTYGCIALTNAEMDEVWKLVPTGTPIEIRH